MPHETFMLDGFEGLNLNIDRYRAVHPATSNAKNVRVKSGRLKPLPSLTRASIGSNLAAWWRLGAANGTDPLLDEEVGAHHLTTSTGSATSAASLISGSSDPAAVITGAWSTPYDAALNTSTFTLVAAVKPITIGTKQTIVHNSNLGPSKGFRLYINTSGYLEARIGTGAGDVQLLSSGALTAGTAYKVGLSYDGTTARLYLEGSVEDSSVTAYSPNTDQALQVVPYGATLDEIVLFSEYLTAAEADAVFDLPDPGVHILPDEQWRDSVYYYTPTNDGLVLFGSEGSLYRLGVGGYADTDLVEASNESVRGMQVWNDAVFFGGASNVRKYVYQSTGSPEDQLSNVSGSPAGTVLGVWRGQLYVATDDMVVRWSDPVLPDEDFTSWPAGNTFDLGGSTSREDEYLVVGAPTPDGFTLFTNLGTYMIYDEETGANTVVDATGGLSGRSALQRDGDYLYGVNQKGVWRTNGREPLQYLTDEQMSSFFTRDCGGFKDMSLAYSSTGWHPATGTIVDRSYFAVFTPINHPFLADDDYVPPRLCVEVDLDTGRCSWHDEVMTGILFATSDPHRSGLGPYAAVPGYSLMVSYGRGVYSIDTETANPNVSDSVYEIALPAFESMVRGHAVNVYGRDVQGGLRVRVTDADRLDPDDGAATQLTPTWKFDQSTDTDAPNVGRVRPRGVRGRSLRIMLEGGDIDVSQVEMEVSRSSRRRN